MTAYVQALLRRLTITHLAGEEGYFVANPALPGVWGSGATVEEALAEFADGVEGWVALARQRGIDVPAIDGVTPEAPGR